MHPSTMDRCREFVERYLDAAAPLKIADVGSYDVNGTYRPLFVNERWTYTGFDLSAGPNVDVILEAPERWGLGEEHLAKYDVVISGQTLEHVRKPWVWIKQVVELCRPGGLIWICAPNTWGYHEHPIDCWRIWPDGMRALFDEAGITEVACGYLAEDTVGIGQRPEAKAD